MGGSTRPPDGGESGSDGADGSRRRERPSESSESGKYWEAAGAGLGAYLFGYGVTYLLKSGAVRRSVIDPSGLVGSAGQAPETWRAVAWLFNGMHYVSGVVRVSRGGESITRELRIAGTGPVWEPWLPLVPVVMLLVFAYAQADDFVGPDASPLTGAKEGAAVVLGYFPAALLGAGGTHWWTSVGRVTLEVGSAIGEAALLAGLVYPLLFGGIGGALAAR